MPASRKTTICSTPQPLGMVEGRVKSTTMLIRPTAIRATAMAVASASGQVVSPGSNRVARP